MLSPVRAEQDLVVAIAPQDLAVLEVLTDLLPGAELADLPEEVGGLDLEHRRAHDPHGPHAHADGVEPAIAHQIRAAHELFFGRAAKHFERALEAELLHRALRRERGADQHCCVDVMALAMAGRAFDNELLRRHAGAL